MAATVVQSGDYLLELDTGFQVDAFTLNDSTKGVLDNTSYVLDGTTQFADITQYATSVTYQRGRKMVDDQFGAGTMSFLMRDETGILGPYDTTSPYYDPANNQPGLAPMRAVRLSRDGQYLFVGVVANYDYQFQLAGPNIVSVFCMDNFYKFSQTTIDATGVTPETSGERIATILALPEVDYIGTTDLDTGTVNLGHSSQYSIPAGTNVLAYLQQINLAEQGRLFCANDGTIVFQNRIGATLANPVITFSDDGTEAKYDNVRVAFDSDGVVNRAYVEALNGNNATDDDPASIAEYFTQTQSITGSLLHEQASIDALATYLLEPDPAPKYTNVSTNFALLTNAQRTAAASVDIGDVITISKMIPGVDIDLSSTLAVEGIDGVIDFARGHRIIYYTSVTTIVYNLILDDATYGVLDSTNVLG